MYKRKENKPKINYTKYYFAFCFIEVEIKNINYNNQVGGNDYGCVSFLFIKSFTLFMREANKSILF